MDGGGEGLYAKRDIKKGEIVAFYNGVRIQIIFIIVTVVDHQKDPPAHKNRNSNANKGRFQKKKKNIGKFQ